MIDITRAGKPKDNVHIGSSNARVRRECRSQLWLLGLEDGRKALTDRMDDDDNDHPESRLENLTWAAGHRAVSFEADRSDFRNLRVW